MIKRLLLTCDIKDKLFYPITGKPLKIALSITTYVNQHIPVMGYNIVMRAQGS